VNKGDEFNRMPEDNDKSKIRPLEGTPVNGRVIFERARRLGEAGDLDRAIEMYLEGIRRAPEAVQDGHVELRVLALKRLESGGPGPTTEEVAKRLGQEGTTLDKMLAAEYLLAKDPENLTYGEAMLHAAVAGGYKQAGKWIADLMFLANNGAKKPSVQLYLLLKESYEAIGEINRALATCQRAMKLKPQDTKLAGDFKRLLGRRSASGRIGQPAGDSGAGQELGPEAEGLGGGGNELGGVGDFRDDSRVRQAPESAGGEDQARAMAFFEKGRRAAEVGSFDYAIDMYLEGLHYAPDAVEEGHVPLGEIGLQRRGKGGKKPSIMDRVKRMRGKTPLEQMLNAEYLFTKDPEHIGHAEAMLKAAVAGGFKRTARWIANVIFQTNNAMENPSLETYLLLKDSYRQVGELDKAVAACQRAVRLKPDDKYLADEFKDLSAELTMSKGKYDVNGDFRQSIKDRDTQTRLYAQDKVVKTENYRLAAVEAARKAYAEDKDLPKNIFGLAEALADVETDEAENEAMRVLEAAYKAKSDFGYKQRAGQVRIRQLRRWLRDAKKALEARPGDAQVAAKVEQLSKKLNTTELEHYRLLMENYPTNLQAKYEYAVRLMRNNQYNEAIPLFQEAQNDPRRRIAAMGKTGYCFFMKSWYTDAIDVLTRAMESYEIKDDATAKEIRYNLARAYEEQGDKGKALELYRKIAQVDFSYKDVSERVDKLRGAAN
jgi:tetratricopeptide (TPR) repeat protein